MNSVYSDKGDKCLDGSDEIKPAHDGHCEGGELMCKAGGGKWVTRDGNKWGGLRVCIKDKYKCDGVRHCRNGEDEANCTQEVPKWCFYSNCDKCKSMYKGYRECEKAYNPPAGGYCEKEDDLMCTARDGKFARRTICVGKKFQCDNNLQCEDGKDEEDCEEEYKKKRIFNRDQRVICRSPFFNITSEENKKGKFFTMRGIRCSHHHHDYHYHPLRFFVDTS